MLMFWKNWAYDNLRKDYDKLWIDYGKILDAKNSLELENERLKGKLEKPPLPYPAETGDTVFYSIDGEGKYGVILRVLYSMNEQVFYEIKNAKNEILYVRADVVEDLIRITEIAPNGASATYHHLTQIYTHENK